MPSFAEGLPVVLMEAFALGRPVVTTYVAGIPELVTDKTCGWLVPAGSVEHLAHAIKQCLNAPDALIETMGAAGRKRVLEQHDIAKECRKLADLFRGQTDAPPVFEEQAGLDQAEPADETCFRTRPDACRQARDKARQRDHASVRVFDSEKRPGLARRIDGRRSRG